MCFTCLHVCVRVCSWACVEVPRYTFYAVNLFVDVVPLPLFFLRYNLFMVLYPSGISGEHGVVGCSGGHRDVLCWVEHGRAWGGW
jgi:hypothetical protein